LALNLRDSGCSVVIGLRRGSKSRRRARRDGFEQVLAVADAVSSADIVCFAFPDHLHGRVFSTYIRQHLKEHATLWLLHGMSVHFRFVVPPSDCDVILIAPHAPGEAVRENYVDKRPYSAFYAIFQDVSGGARKTVFELARAAGIGKRNLIQTTFEAEAIGDMFGEQTVLCGGLASLIKNGFEVLVENGIPPENAYLEVAYQLDLIISLIKKHGLAGMLERISVAARYGALLTGPKIIDKSAKKRMEKVLHEIRSGRFARRLNKLSEDEVAQINRAVMELSSPALERAAKRFSK
jgi:ketol-acid reductoisomerase